MVEIGHPKFTTNANGAVEVRQRGLEGKHLLAGYVTILGRISEAD